VVISTGIGLLNRNVTVTVGQVGEKIGSSIILVFNAVLFLMGLFEALRVRDAPGQFRETKFTFVAFTVITLEAIILVPLSAFDNSQLQSIAIRGFGILFATFAIGLTYFAPKLWFAFENIHVLNDEKRGANQEEARTHRQAWHTLRDHVDPMIRAGAHVAKCSPEEFVDSIASYVHIPMPSPTASIDEKADAVSLWCLPQPTVNIAINQRSSKRNENSIVRETSRVSKIGTEPRDSGSVRSHEDVSNLLRDKDSSVLQPQSSQTHIELSGQLA